MDSGTSNLTKSALANLTKFCNKQFPNGLVLHQSIYVLDVYRNDSFSDDLQILSVVRHNYGGYAGRRAYVFGIHLPRIVFLWYFWLLAGVSVFYDTQRWHKWGVPVRTGNGTKIDLCLDGLGVFAACLYHLVCWAMAWLTLNLIIPRFSFPPRVARLSVRPVWEDKMIVRPVYNWWSYKRAGVSNTWWPPHCVGTVKTYLALFYIVHQNGRGQGHCRTSDSGYCFR